MRRSPPLRFLVAVLGGWAAMRAAVTAPPWSTPPADAAAAAASPRPGAVAASGGAPAFSRAPAPEGRAAAPRAARIRVRPPPRRPLQPHLGRPAAARPVAAPGWAGLGRPRAQSALPPASLNRFTAAPDAIPPGPREGRWSLSAWSFVRRGGSASLAGGGVLGGSQAGARLAYRLNGDRTRPLALSGRLSLPLRRPAGAEAALGLDWRPSRRLPLHLLAERRQALGRKGRSAFGLTLYAGAGDAPLGPFRVDAYGQAGLVGARSRDPFGDGSVRVSLPLGPRARLGAGAWAAAQPGASRVDAGPQAALRLTLARRPATLAADWRFRLAGTAEPGSGPTLTLSSDF